MDAGGFQAKNISADSYEHSDCICLVASASDELLPVTALERDHLPAWQKLASNASEPNIFYENWMLEPALRHFKGNAGLHIFLFWAGVPLKSDLLGLLPLGPSRNFGRWPVPHVQNWMHHNSFLGTPLVRKGFENQFWTRLFARLDDVSWPGFFHLNGLTVGGSMDQALREVCCRQGRRCDLVYSEARAFLESNLDAGAYFEQNMRSKKRKELRRQKKRLGELGVLQFATSRDDAALEQWTSEFLALERRGWKGRNGSALDCSDETRGFFAGILKHAASAGQLERHDLRLDGKPLAMLVNFISGAGSFSFKTAFDEDYARFSPGVLLQRENLNILNDPCVQWMDSCAAENHPMIDSLWSGRRHVGRFSVEMKGLSRTAIFRGVRFGEEIMAQLKGREIIDVMEDGK